MVLLASLFFVRAMPLDMPRAEAYLVTEPSGRMRLEDRYDELDLWTSRAVLGRWIDDSGRLFTVARLHEVAPEKTSSLTSSQAFFTAAAMVSETAFSTPCRSASPPYPCTAKYFAVSSSREASFAAHADKGF